MRLPGIPERSYKSVPSGWVKARRSVRCLPAVVVSLVLVLLPGGSLSHAQQQTPQTAQPQPPKAASSKQPAQGRASIEEERLNILRSDIEREIEAYKKLKKEAEESVKVIDDKSREKLLKLSKMYEAMSAEEAARKIEKLDDETAVMLLVTLKPKTAGKILAQIESERAASLSKKILAKGKSLPAKNSN